MCGIVGHAGLGARITKARLEVMRDAIAHRGPDGFGLVRMDEQGRACPDDQPAAVGLGHRRLSIIDLSSAGAQPMSNEDGSCWITFNGEFYNFQDYRAGLEAKGHIFRSHCDTETILHLYEEHGIEQTLASMNGMFAFGIWDSHNRTLVMARDRVGKKPLYYAQKDGGLIFASELKSLYASGLIDPGRLDDLAVAESLISGTPFHDRTMFAEIRALPAGHYAVWKDGTLSVRRYYRNPFEDPVAPVRDIEDAADELEELLVDAIRLRLVADVPVGLFLSGGVDSSLVAALTARRLNRPIQAYCISFQQEGYDESAHARSMADHLGLPITIMPAAASNRALFENIARHIDQPLGDASLVPTFQVSQSAHDANVKVVLTGDGGDEVFGGYDLYRTAVKLWGAPSERALIRQARTPAERLWEWRTRARGFERGYLALQNQFSLKHRAAMYRNPWHALALDRQATAWRISVLSRVRHRPVLDRMQYSDMHGMMIDDVLRKVDLMSMAHALECRSPLLDYRVIEFASRLSFADKIDPGGRGKRILRHLLGRHVPSALFERPKMGFCMPWESTCRGAYAGELKARWRACDMPHLKPGAGDWIFEQEGVGGMFRKWNAFVHLVFFEQYRTWCWPG